jgi:hypothetical protein
MMSDNNALGKEEKSASGDHYTSELGTVLFGGLCLGVGGMKGILLLGALHEFWVRGQLKNLTYYSGSSVGALIVALLAIGYEPLELLTIMCDPYFTSQFGVLNFGNLGTIMGLFPHSILRTKLEEIILLKLGYLPTFGDLLKRLHKHIIITAYCLSESDPQKSKVYFDPISYSEMPIIEAVILSCNIPGIFQRAKWNDKIWVDGAYTSLFPIEALETVCPKHCPILGLMLKSEAVDMDTLAGYFYAVMSIPFRNRIDLSGLRSDIQIVEISSQKNVRSVMSSINFSSTNQEKITMFTFAVKQIQEIIKGKGHI